MWVKTYDKKIPKYGDNMKKRRFPPNRYIPFSVKSVEHQTDRAFLVKLDIREESFKPTQKAELENGIWLPFSQCVLDPKDNSFIWVAEWLCRKNNMIPKEYHTGEFEVAKKWHRHEWLTIKEVFNQNRPDTMIGTGALPIPNSTITDIITGA
tara:strand:+ start:37 stop:492 length:456 start_codon:yes stop_codon:yes gene_type:complete